MPCPACLKALETCLGTGCRRCGNPAVHNDCEDCDWCRALRVKPGVIASPFAYRGDGQTLYQRIKYGGCWRYLKPLMTRSLPRLHAAGLFNDRTCIVPIPASPRNRVRRLFNPPLEIARLVSESTGIPIVDALRSRLFVRPQVGLSRSERQRNAAGKFALRCAPPGAVLLVDDVLTTGATLEAATRLLIRAGAPSVHWFTLFRKP